LLEEAERFVQAQALAEQEDIFYLTRSTGNRQLQNA
jgi:hypothetical protein